MIVRTAACAKGARSASAANTTNARPCAQAQHQAAVQQQRDLRESSSTLAEPLPSAAAARGRPPCEAGRTDDSSGAVSRTPESHALSAAAGGDNRGGTPAQGQAEPEHGGVECSTAQLSEAENCEAVQSRGDTAEGGAAATAAGSAGRLQSARELGGAARAQLHQVCTHRQRRCQCVQRSIDRQTAQQRHGSDAGMWCGLVSATQLSFAVTLWAVCVQLSRVACLSPVKCMSRHAGAQHSD